ncbi:MAG: SRPBCC domain-containing protein [Planctomycetes bacterium]|nr:SRPBCC domain-containing protein [Planctomycetota bacterium]
MAAKKKTLVVSTKLWVRASPAKVWAALTNERQLARWYTKADKNQLRKGGNWGFRGGQSTGRVVELKRNKRFVHTQQDDPKWPVMKLDYSIEKVGKVSCLTITHSGFGSNRPLRQHWVGAWPFISQNLKTLLETGKPMWEGTWA